MNLENLDCISVDSFLKEWEEQYRDLKSILHYLRTYPEVLSNLKLEIIQDPDNIDSEQKDWIWLCSKFTHSLDKDFFKPYWIPIVKDSYDFFIDISDESYPVFEIKYFWLEPYRWYKKFLTTDIRELLLAHDKKINLSDLLEKNEQQHRESIKELFDKRRSLGFEGKLYVKKVKLHEVPTDSGKGIEYKINRKNVSLKVNGVTPLIVGLLSHNIRIYLKSLEVYYGDKFHELTDVKNIRDMVFVLRELGIKRIKSYSIDLLKTEGHIVFDKNVAIVELSDLDLQQDIIVALKSLSSN